MDTVIEITRIVSHAPEAIFSCLRHALVILECIGIFRYAALKLIQFSKLFAEGMLKIFRHICSVILPSRNLRKILCKVGYCN